MKYYNSMEGKVEMGNYVYVYRNEHEIFYIGKSEDVHVRMKQHRDCDEWYKDLPDDYFVLYHRCGSKKRMNTLEKKLISFYQPMFNGHRYLNLFADEYEVSNIQWKYTSWFLKKTETLAKLKNDEKKTEAIKYAKYIKRLVEAKMKKLYKLRQKYEAELIDYPIVLQKLLEDEFFLDERLKIIRMELPLNNRLINSNPRSKKKYPYLCHEDISDKLGDMKFFSFGIWGDYYSYDYSRHFFEMHTETPSDIIIYWRQNMEQLLVDINNQIKEIDLRLRICERDLKTYEVTVDKIKNTELV